MSRAVADRIAVLGAMALTDEELVVALCGRDGRSEERVARALRWLGGLRALAARASPSRLVGCGLTPAEARRLLAAAELAHRLYRPGPGAVIRGPADIAAQAVDLVGAEEVESLVLLSLDRRHAVISRVIVSRGCAHATVMDPPSIFRVALRHGASAIALAHNHPSGDPAPAREDLAATAAVAAAGEVLRGPLLDHVVVAGARWHSIAVEAGLAERRSA